MQALTTTSGADKATQMLFRTTPKPVSDQVAAFEGFVVLETMAPPADIAPVAVSPVQVPGPPPGDSFPRGAPVPSVAGALAGTPGMTAPAIVPPVDAPVAGTPPGRFADQEPAALRPVPAAARPVAGTGVDGPPPEVPQAVSRAPSASDPVPPHPDQARVEADKAARAPESRPAAFVPDRFPTPRSTGNRPAPAPVDSADPLAPAGKTHSSESSARVSTSDETPRSSARPAGNAGPGADIATPGQGRATSGADDDAASRATNLTLPSGAATKPLLAVAGSRPRPDTGTAPQVAHSPAVLVPDRSPHRPVEVDRHASGSRATMPPEAEPGRDTGSAAAQLRSAEPVRAVAQTVPQASPPVSGAAPSMSVLPDAPWPGAPAGTPRKPGDSGPVLVVETAASSAARQPEPADPSAPLRPDPKAAPAISATADDGQVGALPWVAPAEAARGPSHADGAPDVAPSRAVPEGSRAVTSDTSARGGFPLTSGDGTAEFPMSEPRPAEARAVADTDLARADPARNDSPRAETGRAAAAQVVEVLRRVPDGPVEISLSPEELGRVRLTLQGSEAAMTVQIVADRPETLELLRRNVDMLAADLREQGYADLQFDFGGGDRQPPRSARQDDSPSAATQGAPQARPDAGPPARQPLRPSQGLNLRL